MRLNDLPRLTDEERDALDTCVAIEGVQAFTIDDLLAERTAALYAMRTAGSDWTAFSAASKREAELAAQIRRLRRNLVAIAAATLALSGCSLTPTQQKWAGFAAGVLVVGAIAAHDSDSGKPPASLDVLTPTVPCSNPESCR